MSVKRPRGHTEAYTLTLRTLLRDERMMTALTPDQTKRFETVLGRNTRKDLSGKTPTEGATVARRTSYCRR